MIGQQQNNKANGMKRPPPPPHLPPPNYTIVPSPLPSSASLLHLPNQTMCALLSQCSSVHTSYIFCVLCLFIHSSDFLRPFSMTQMEGGEEKAPTERSFGSDNERTSF
uniref:Uncharacterized protein n=1 Tax=Globodera rostochiensis TaxID=31243 RepID=A0A914GUF7_GLORO